VLDEPSSGLDPVVRRDILEAIIRTVADEGRTVLFSSHLLDEVQHVSDRVAMLHSGRLVLSSPLDALLESHCRWTVWFEQPPDDLSLLPGALSWAGAGREWTIVANGQQATLADRLREMNAEIVDRRPPTLNEIFVARMQFAAEPTAR
jgi:ABC-2 type transport system ATP-binding protein